MASKLRRPAPRRGTVSRSSLIGQLTRDDSRPIVSVVAPPGYGKTTLLSQWAEHDGRAVAWVSVDERDYDPKVLLSYVAEALASRLSSCPARWCRGWARRSGQCPRP